MNTLESIIYPVIDLLQGMFAPGEGLRKDPDTVLFGSGSSLDSIKLFHFVVACEEQIKKMTGVKVKLATPQAMRAAERPFRTLGTLAVYISELVCKRAGT